MVSSDGYRFGITGEELFQSRNREAYGFKLDTSQYTDQSFSFQSRNREAYGFKFDVAFEVYCSNEQVSIS